MQLQWQAAFGVAPPASAPTGADAWARAVELGARGWAAAARSMLDELARDARSAAAVRSLALATRGSLTRQVGRHAVARGDDGTAARIAFAQAPPHTEWTRAARVDALVGLAADGLGIGDFGASSRLLQRASSEIDAGRESEGAGSGGWVCDGRPRLRLAWVRAELALYSGDPRAAEYAARAADLAAEAPSLRHRVKTELIVAASSAAAGEVEGAARAAERIVATCREQGLLPLEWAAQSMLAGSRPGTSSRPADLRQAELIARGMSFTPLRGRSDLPRYP